MEWLNQSETCPIDRISLTSSPQDLKPALRIIQNLIDKLEISCEYADYGCDKFIRNDMLSGRCVNLIPKHQNYVIVVQKYFLLVEPQNTIVSMNSESLLVPMKLNCLL